jgi:hypothetical protein
MQIVKLRKVPHIANWPSKQKEGATCEADQSL